MGNSTHASEDDYRLYARPNNGQSQDSVQIVDDGGAPDSGGLVPAGGGTSSRAGRYPPADGEGPDGGLVEPARGAGEHGPAAPTAFSAREEREEPLRRRFNPYLCAAWVLVAGMLVAGVSWLTGALEPPTYVSVDPSTGQGMEAGQGAIAMNLYSMGPFLLLFGLMGAFTLLTVQAAAFRRARSR